LQAGRYRKSVEVYKKWEIMNPYSQMMSSSASETDSLSRLPNPSDFWTSRQLTVEQNIPPLLQRTARQAPFLPSV
jgi:hypothetical protein